MVTNHFLTDLNASLTLFEVFIMDLWEFYRSICSSLELSTTDPSVVLQSGALQKPKYLNTLESVVLHSGVLQIPK